jgi:hypothetical protein
LRPGASFLEECSSVARRGVALVRDAAQERDKFFYSQFAAERTGAFTWEYLEQGPEVWRVEIGKPA